MQTQLSKLPGDLLEDGLHKTINYTILTFLFVFNFWKLSLYYLGAWGVYQFWWQAVVGYYQRRNEHVLSFLEISNIIEITWIRYPEGEGMGSNQTKGRRVWRRRGGSSWRRCCRWRWWGHWRRSCCRWGRRIWMKQKLILYIHATNAKLQLALILFKNEPYIVFT